MSYFTHLECSAPCGAPAYDPRVEQHLCVCGAPLLARYDLERARAWQKHTLAGREPNMWRYRELMPLFEGIFRPLLDEARGARNRRIVGLGVALAIAVSLALPALGLVVLKMLPFDNKSEFQVVVDMPAGTPVERTAAVLRDMGALLARQPEVTDYQAYAGTASPINFNGLVRQYDLRSGGESGDIQVNLQDKHLRREQSHAIASRLRPQLAASGAYLATGKFDAHRDRPYDGWVVALESLIQQLLVESDSRLKVWGSQLREGLGNIAGALIELVPDLAFVVGDVPAIPRLGPQETQARLSLALQRFVQVAVVE